MHDFEEKFFSQKQEFERKFFSKKHNFDWEFFCRKHDFQWIFFRLVRFWIKIFLASRILNWIFFILLDLN